MLGNLSLINFDYLIIGSGAGGSAAACVLAENGKRVLVIEAGSNYFPGLDNPDIKSMSTLFSNDELKLHSRGFIQPDPILEPRTFRQDESKVREHLGNVNHLPKTVGGGGVHADLKMPRFLPFDFRLGKTLGNMSGATFADWPVSYDELEVFYDYVERVIGVQGQAGENPDEGWRSRPFPMAPGNPMYLGLKASAAAKSLGYHPFNYPSAVNSRVYDQRPACSDCGFCGSYGCTTHAKGSPAVTLLRRALLTGNCQLRPDTRAVDLSYSPSSKNISGVTVINAQGKREVLTAETYFLAASPIESVRLLKNSDRSRLRAGPGLGNSSGMVGRNLTFHFQTIVVGIFEERLHGYRGRTVSHGMSDFRGIPGDPSRPLGGIVEFGAAGEPIREAMEYANSMGLSGPEVKNLIKQSPLRDRIMVFTMQAEDAPQYTNQVDLDPEVVDFDGLPVPRITYQNHEFELKARKFYSPKLLDLMGKAGAKYGIVAPLDTIPDSRHIMGTLRFGDNSKTSVCNRVGRFHDIGNLFAADGSLFPTSTGYNPTLTISTLAAWVAANCINPQSPGSALK